MVSCIGYNGTEVRLNGNPTQVHGMNSIHRADVMMTTLVITRNCSSILHKRHKSAREIHLRRL